MYKIKDIQQVGNYAIQIHWSDGHNTGIYNWEYLKLLEKSQNSDGNQKYSELI